MLARMRYAIALLAICATLTACGVQGSPTPLPTLGTSTAAPPMANATPKVIASETTARPSQTPVPPTETTAPPTAAPTAQTLAQATTELPEDTAVLINGQAISRETYLRRVAQARSYFLQQPGLDAASEAGKQALARLDQQVLQWLIDQVLIEQSAEDRGIHISDQEIEATLDAMRGDDPDRFANWLASNALTMDELRTQVRYDLLTAAMRDLVTSQVPREVEQIHVRHILTSEESAARRAVQALRAGGNFIALARQISEDATTRSTGGDLGFLPYGVMPPTFDEVAFAMEPGEISDVVRSEFGFHVIQVVEIDPARRVPDELWPVVQERAFATWLEEQHAQASIQVASWVTEGQEG
ncbi:MAG: peptidylprolyl isomerase [Anaerolineae bacterium]